MEIETMKDLKDTLSKIPDEVLDNFCVCRSGESGEIAVLTNKGETELEMAEYWKDMMNKHLELVEVNKFVKNIVKEAESKSEDTDNFEPITSN